MRWCFAWLLFYAGDLVARLEWLMPDCMAERVTFYPVYNKLMIWSGDIQGDGPGPWEVMG